MPPRHRPAFKLKPPPAGTFARTLWSILRTGNDNLNEAAARLQVTLAELSNILRGHRAITSHYVQDKAWRKSLARHYPQGWQRHAARFEAQAAKLKQRAGRQPRIPEDRGSFGYILWTILGGRRIDLPLAAQRLKLSSERLSGIVHGHTSLSRRFVSSKQWDRVLAEHYPDTWSKHRASFLARLETLAAYRGDGAHAQKKPEDRSSFGYIVWKILGGRAIGLPLAAQRLGLPKGRLSAILHSHIRPSQQFVTSRQWDRVLGLHYPQAWATHRDAFFARLETLTAHPGADAGSAEPPRDGKSFGYALWLVLGAKVMDRERASALLQIPNTTLSTMIHGEKKPTQSLLKRKCWRETIAQHYPQGWQDYGEVFETRALRLKTHRGAKTASQDSGAKLAAILRMILGTDAESLKTAAMHLRMRPSMLQKILDGRTRIQPRFIRNKHWPQILAENYPVQWQRHRDAFLAALEEKERLGQRQRRALPAR